MKILVDESSLSKWKERFGEKVDEAISLGKDLFSQYKEEESSEMLIIFSSNFRGNELPEQAKLSVTFRGPGKGPNGEFVMPSIFFSATE